MFCDTDRILTCPRGENIVSVKAKLPAKSLLALELKLIAETHEHRSVPELLPERDCANVASLMNAKA